jgi:predicted PurR-regulated permease PerM
MAGALSIIPMVGSTLGLVVSVAVAWFQSGTWEYTAVIAAIFLVGQFVEGNFLTPKLLGDSVGLHPLWILFALLAGGALFGIVGMLLAVPVVATIGVLANFAIRLYKNSAYYNAPADTQKKKKADRAE